MNKRKSKKEARKTKEKQRHGGGGGGKRGRRKDKEKEWREHFEAFQKGLNSKGLYMREIDGDGNCLFRSFSDQFHGVEVRHHEYRALAVEYMEENPDEFKPYLDEDEMKFEDYLKMMSKAGEWGDHFELQALSRKLKINIVIHMKSGAPMCIFNFPKKTRTIHLAYHMEENFGEHYSSVRNIGDDFFDAARPINLDSVLGANALEKATRDDENLHDLAEDVERMNINDDNDEQEEQKNNIAKPQKEKKNKGKKEKEPEPAEEEAEYVSKNQKCPCGSGKKYKNCCIHKKKPNKKAKEAEETAEGDKQPKVTKAVIII